MNVQSFDDIYDKCKSLMIAGQTKITDFNKGSVISSMFEAFSRILERLYIDTKNGYSANLIAVAYSIFGFKKKEGTKATAKVVFSRNVASSLESVIPIGTKVSSGSYIFITTTVGTIGENELTSNDIYVQAEKIGISYNVAAGTINTIESILSSDIVSVSNALKASGGTNEESETELLARFKEFINGLQGTNEYGLKSSILALEGVRSCSIDEHFPPENNIYNATCYIDDGTGGLTPALKEQIESIIDGDDTSVNPGKRATGIQIRVLPATAVTINVNVTCTIYRTEHATAMFDIENAIQEEINSLGIDEDFVLTSLILRLRRISYVKDVVINSPTTNVAININQIARFGSADITLKDL